MTTSPEPTEAAGETALATYRVYGASMATALPLVTPLPGGDGTPDVRVVPAPEDTLASAFEGNPSFAVLEERADGPSRRLEFRQLAGGTAAVRITDFADVLVGPERIRYTLSPDAAVLHMEILLLGYLLALWLEMRGVLALHASTVGVEKATAGFLAVKEGGKSSLAGGMLAAGGGLLSDDLLALRPTEGEWLAAPGFPQIRMWPEAARRFGLVPDELERVHPATAKRRVPIGGDGFGGFLPEERPLTALYVPEPAHEAAGSAADVEITRLRGAEAATAVLGASFLRRELGALELERARLGAVGDLVRAVPVKRLRYPWGWEHLPRVIDAVREDLG